MTKHLPFFRKGGLEGDNATSLTPWGMRTVRRSSAQANSWEGGTAKAPFPPSPAWKGYRHQWRQTPVASAPPSPNHDMISHRPSLAAGATVTTASVRSHPPATFTRGAP